METGNPKISESMVSNQKLIFNILLITPLLFALMLSLFETMELGGVEPGDNTLFDYLPLILGVVSLVEFFLAFVYFRSIIDDLDNYQEIYGYTLISTTLLVAVGIYGLLIGLLDLFVAYGRVRWEYAGLFFIASFVSILYYTRTIVFPKLENTSDHGMDSSKNM